MYNKFYAFSENPFELTLDRKFLFLTPSHREAIASMINGIRSRSGFISVMGEAGTGKTLLIRFLIGKLEAEERVKIAFTFHPTVTFKELLKNILLELDLEVVNRSKGALLRQLNEYLIQGIHGDETVVVIIDEAQDLSIEVMGELGMLAKLERLQIVFVGQPKFENKLYSQGLRQLEQKIGIRCQIKPLSERETKDYIDHRLRLVGSRSSQVFTSKAISAICAYAQGITRITNILCDNALLMGYRLSRKTVDADIIHEVIRSMENPARQKTSLSKIVAAADKFRLFPLQLDFLLSKASLIVLSFLCVGGLILLFNRYLQPADSIRDVKSLRSPSQETKQSLAPPPAQEVMKPNSKSDTAQRSDDLKPIFPKSLQVVSPMTSPLADPNEEDEIGETATIKEGETISFLTKKYYHMVNRTVMDLILVLNPEINDIDLILVDQKIKIPKITKKLLVIKSPENAHKINAGTFKTQDAARIYSNERALKEKRVAVLPRKVSPRDTWYRVVIGDFDSEDEALRMIDLLKKEDLLPAFGGLPDID